MIYLGLKNTSTVKGNLFITTNSLIPDKDGIIYLLFDDIVSIAKIKEVTLEDLNKSFDILSDTSNKDKYGYPKNYVWQDLLGNWVQMGECKSLELIEQEKLISMLLKVMNKEQQQIIDEVYEKYSIIAGMSTQVVSLTKDTFIHYIKTDVKFSETWGIKIEERELNHDERFEIYKKVSGSDLQPHISGINFKQFHFDESKIPTKLITLTYKNEKIESYE